MPWLVGVNGKRIEERKTSNNRTTSRREYSGQIGRERNRTQYEFRLGTERYYNSLAEPLSVSIVTPYSWFIQSGLNGITLVHQVCRVNSDLKHNCMALIEENWQQHLRQTVGQVNKPVGGTGERSGDISGFHFNPWNYLSLKWLKRLLLFTTLYVPICWYIIEGHNSSGIFPTPSF